MSRIEWPSCFRCARQRHISGADERRQTLCGFVEDEQASDWSSAPGRSRASAARRRRDWPRGCGRAPPALGTVRRCARASRVWPSRRSSRRSPPGSHAPLGWEHLPPLGNQPDAGRATRCDGQAVDPFARQSDRASARLQHAHDRRIAVVFPMPLRPSMPTTSPRPPRARAEQDLASPIGRLQRAQRSNMALAEIGRATSALARIAAGLPQAMTRP